MIDEMWVSQFLVFIDEMWVSQFLAQFLAVFARSVDVQVKKKAPHRFLCAEP
jgi:hypothetical protein